MCTQTWTIARRFVEIASGHLVNREREGRPEVKVGRDVWLSVSPGQVE